MRLESVDMSVLLMMYVGAHLARCLGSAGVSILICTQCAPTLKLWLVSPSKQPGKHATERYECVCLASNYTPAWCHRLVVRSAPIVRMFCGCSGHSHVVGANAWGVPVDQSQLLLVSRRPTKDEHLNPKLHVVCSLSSPMQNAWGWILIPSI